MVARQHDDLTVESVHDEVLVFNPWRGNATALNPSAALVFSRCDGTNTIQSIRQDLDAAGLGPSSDDTVWLALSELAAAGLIELHVSRPDHLNRRELLMKLGAGAAALAALPVVETIRAPTVAAAGSGLTPAPTSTPTETPTTTPTTAPTETPTTAPTFTPTETPTTTPTSTPTETPTTTPTTTPTSAPTETPTTAPTSTPTGVPTTTPTSAPTGTPTTAPTPTPTRHPKSAPTRRPTPAPTAA